MTADANNQGAYDTFSAPDMFMRIILDENCDGTYVTADSQIYLDDYNPTTYDILSFDIADDLYQFCFIVEVYDNDVSAEALLDYAPGQGETYNYQFSTSSITSAGIYVYEDNNGSNENFGATAAFELSIDLA